MAYRVKLGIFEGPLDLLLFLIKKNEVDIYDIPIALLTRQYLEYLDIIKLLDLEGAGDFILLAATLIRIKAQMLLPRDPDLEEEDEEDPRQELVRRLLEYQQFKHVATDLGEFEVKSGDYYSRGYINYEFKETPEDFLESAGEVTLFDLMAAFKKVLLRIPKISQHTVEQVPVSIDDQMDYVLQELALHNQLLFVDLLARLPGKIYMIVTFIALLEMMRRGLVSATQSTAFGEIWIKKI